MANQLAKEGHTVEEVAPSNIQAGTFAFTAGKVKFYSRGGQAGGDIQAGELTAPYYKGVQVWVDKANVTDVFTQFANVFGSEANQNALTVGGDGQMGIAAEASSATDTQVLVIINER